MTRFGASLVQTFFPKLAAGPARAAPPPPPPPPSYDDGSGDDGSGDDGSGDDGSVPNSSEIAQGTSEMGFGAMHLPHWMIPAAAGAAGYALYRRSRGWG